MATCTLIFCVVFKFLNQFGRDSANERIVGDILGHDSTSCYNHIIADGDSW